MRDGFGDGVARRHRDLARVAQELRGELLDVVRERGREHQRLALFRQVVQHPLQRRQEAHVEHAVGFVQHQGVDRRQVRGALAEVVEQAARRRDQHVEAAAQRIDLRLHADAAEDGGRAQGRVRAVVLEAVEDLRREFARRRQHQHARGATGRARRAFRKELGQDRQREAAGLAGAGLRRGHEVVAGEDERDGLLLDRRRRVVAERGERAQDRGREPEVGKHHGCAPERETRSVPKHRATRKGACAPWVRGWMALERASCEAVKRALGNRPPEEYARSLTTVAPAVNR